MICFSLCFSFADVHSVMSSYSAYSCRLMLLVAVPASAQLLQDGYCFLIRQDTCKCGYLKTEHVREAIDSTVFSGQTWNMHRHIRGDSTDAFGDISFGGLGQKTAKVKLGHRV